MKLEASSFISHRLCYFGIVIAIMFPTKQISVEKNQGSVAHECGSAVPAKISYSTTGPRNTSAPAFPDPTIILEAVLPYAGQSRLLMRIEKPRGPQRPSQYISDDRGETWRMSDWVLGYSNLPTISRAERLMSHVDRRILYDCYYICKDGFELSKDGGVTWAHVNPTVSGEDTIEEIQLIDTGTHSACRVYAMIWSNGRKDFRAAVSNDYGQSFELLTRDVGIVVESRADSNVLYGSIPRQELLGISRDNGAKWIPLPASSEFWRPIYYNPSRGYFRSWKEYPDDKEWPPLAPIVQIESDPTHPQWIYVLTEKGLYISRDGGQSFRLATLAQGRVRSIDRIAVDPINGRFVYAALEFGQFYRSSDYGCSWQQMKLPPLPNR
jgi:hypothetical protein